MTARVHDPDHDSHREEVLARVAGVFGLGRGTPVRYRLRSEREQTFADLVHVEGGVATVRPWGRIELRRFGLARVALADVAVIPTRAEVARIAARQAAWGTR